MNALAKMMLGIVPVCVIAFAAYFVFGHPAPAAQNAQTAAAAAAADGVIASSTVSGVSVSADAISQAATPPAGYVEYKNEKYGFSFFHPADGKIQEYDEGGGAETVVYENDSIIRGLQVFIVPYAEPTISEARFRMDVPSGVRTNVENAMLDGVRAVTFNSEDELLGSTREIWIIKNGYLYEITTFSGVGNWFTPIIQSWRWSS